MPGAGPEDLELSEATGCPLGDEIVVEHANDAWKAKPLSTIALMDGVPEPRGVGERRGAASMHQMFRTCIAAVARIFHHIIPASWSMPRTTTVQHAPLQYMKGWTTASTGEPLRYEGVGAVHAAPLVVACAGLPESRINRSVIWAASTATLAFEGDRLDGTKWHFTPVRQTEANRLPGEAQLPEPGIFPNGTLEEWPSLYCCRLYTSPSPRDV